MIIFIFFLTTTREHDSIDTRLSPCRSQLRNSTHLVRYETVEIREHNYTRAKPARAIIEQATGIENNTAIRTNEFR